MAVVERGAWRRWRSVADGERGGENGGDLTAVLEISTGGSGTAWLQPIDDGEVRRPAVKKMAIALLRCLRARVIHRRGAARGSRGDGRLEEARRARWLQIRLTAARGVLGAARERERQGREEPTGRE